MDLSEQLTKSDLLLDTRVCRTCQVEKNLLEDYYLSRKNPGLASSYSYQCKECTLKRVNAYGKKNRPHIRDKFLQRNYGITSDDFNNMLTEQQGRCGICGTDKPGGKHERFHVDHCHDSNKVRGLLCSNCNTFIGLAKHNVDTLEKAVLYLQKTE